MGANAAVMASFSGEMAELAERLARVLVSVRSAQGGGSGTVWTKDGLVVTNHHVVPGDSATVVLHDGNEFEATVEARDPERDLALLRVPAVLTPAEPGDSADARPGTLAFAIGNPWGQRGTLTSGIVVSRGTATEENGAHLTDVLRADVRLAPGNSGGPMTDARGRVIGINSMIAGGMAIAVPVDAVKAFVAEALAGKPGRLGIAFQPVRVPHAIAASYEVEDDAGLILTGIEPGSPAETAGLIPGDIVIGAGPGRRRGLRYLESPLRSMRAGQQFELQLLRGGKLVQVAAVPV